jgi:hypothetical protein
MARSIDGFQGSAKATAPAPTIPRSRLQTARASATPSIAITTPVAAAVPQRRFTPTEPIHHKPSLRERLQTPLLIVACMLTGFFFQDLWFGVIAIGLYGIGTFVFHINSRITFTLSFISLVSVIALLLIKQNVALASNFATYTFLLLVIGVIALSFEAKPRGRKKRRNGR